MFNVSKNVQLLYSIVDWFDKSLPTFKRRTESLVAEKLRLQEELFKLRSFRRDHEARKLHLLNLAFNCGAIIFVSFVSILNFKIYGEFGTMLNARAFDALVHSKESLGFVSLWSVLLLIIVSLFFAFLGIKVYRRYVFNFSYPIENVRLKFAQVIIFPILLGIFFRGGLQSVPINENSPHYSDVSINNYIATNNIWYLAHSFLNPEEGEDVYFH